LRPEVDRRLGGDLLLAVHLVSSGAAGR
jgi:hypothetical protein